MKIGIDTRCLMQNNYSGVSWYTFNLLKYIFELDDKNEYILFYNNSKPVKMPEFKKANVKYVGFNYSNKVFSSKLHLLGKPKIDEMIGGVDAFFMPNINFAAFSSNCKRIITVHDLSFLRYPQFLTLKSRIWHNTLLSKKIIQDADKIIAVSENTKCDLIELLDVDENKIRVIYEGVDSKFKPIDNRAELERVRRKYKLPARFVLYIGTLEPRKNIGGIIEAYNKLDTDHSLVIGGGNGWKSKEIMKLVKKSDKIKLIGYVGEDDKRGLYSLASLFVYPSYYEGFGLPVIEAMACGTPVIAGSNSSQMEVVAGAGLLVDPYNINEITSAMNFALKDSNLRNKLINLGFERVGDFNWKNTAINTLKILT
jgi:glycosyltransferase involved in cell wall biosynthesis